MGNRTNEFLDNFLLNSKLIHKLNTKDLNVPICIIINNLQYFLKKLEKHQNIGDDCINVIWKKLLSGSMLNTGSQFNQHYRFFCLK